MSCKQVDSWAMILLNVDLVGFISFITLHFASILWIVNRKILWTDIWPTGESASVMHWVKDCHFITLTMWMVLLMMTKGHLLQPCGDYGIHRKYDRGIQYKLCRRSCMWQSISDLNISLYVDLISIKTNALTHLQPYLVANFPHLTQLILKQCNISSIHKDAFKNASKLVKIDICRNNLKSLPDGLFVDQSQCLEYLHLEHNQIADISSSTFHNLTSLIQLNLQYNKDLIIEPYAFQHVFTTKLSISHCAIKSVENRTFYGLLFKPHRVPSRLLMDSNDLSILVDRAFSSVSELAHLDLRDNKITTIHQFAFIDLTSLTTLDLRNNHLTVLDCQILSPLKHIHHIDLQHNNLVGIIHQCPAHFISSLEGLYLQGNNISSLWNLFAGRPLTWPNVGSQVLCKYCLTSLKLPQ